MTQNHRPPRIFLAALVAVLAMAIASAGVFRPEPYPSWKDRQVSQKLNLFTFYEEHEGLKVFASSEVMRFHDKETFVPMLVAVANGNSRPVLITPEEFVLTDDQGIYYPLAEHEVLLKEYKKSAYDREMVLNAQFLGNKFLGFEQVPSLFYPNIVSTGVKNDRIHLPQSGYFADVLYFRKPIGPLEGRIFTLTVYFPQQETQMDVKLLVPGKPKDG
jgi:hypothetical protein